VTPASPRQPAQTAVTTNAEVAAALPEGLVDAAVARILARIASEPIATVPEPSSSNVQFNVALRSLLNDPAVRKAVARATEPKGPSTVYPNTWQAQFRYVGPGTAVGSNVFWGRSSSFTGATGQCQQVATCYQNAWSYNTDVAPAAQSLRYMLTPAWTLDEIVVSDNGGTTDNYYVLPVGLDGLYSPSQAPAAPQVAAVISWDIDQRYKGGHPRTYLPGIDQAAFAAEGSNTWGTAFITALKAAALTFLTQLVANLLAAGFASAEPIIISRFSKGPRPSAVPFAITNSSANPVTVNERIDTQRRRLGKEITTR
jgi:hypothetical protein